MNFYQCPVNVLLKKSIMTKTTASRKFNNFVTLNILWVFVLLLSCTKVIQAASNYQIPYYYWSNGNILWVKATNGEQNTMNNKISYLWPSTNGVIQVADYSAKPLYGTLPGSYYDGNMNFIRQNPENTQNDLPWNNNNNNNNNDRNNNNNANTTPQPEKHYLHPCLLKVCNIAK